MKRCIACGAPLWETPLLTLDNMPASAQHMPGADSVDKDQGLTLDLCQCTGCGLVQFDCEPVDYYRDVIRAGGFSKTMVELRRYQYRHLIDTYGLEGKRFIEVGCGQGEFLKVLSEFPVEAFGIEHDAKLVEAARAQGLAVSQGFTESEDTVFPGGLYDVFLSFNFLEHQPNPNTMLQAIYRNLEDDGMGLITVPSFEYIMDHDSYYELIRDHIAYYVRHPSAASGEKRVSGAGVRGGEPGYAVRDCEKTSPDGDGESPGRLCGAAAGDGKLYEVSESVEQEGGPLGGQPSGLYPGGDHAAGKICFLYY